MNRYSDTLRRVAPYLEGDVLRALAELERMEGDATNEFVDAHEFVTYTAKNFDVLRHCSNHDAYTEEFGEVPTDDGNINWAALAFAAFRQDVSEALANLPEEEGKEGEA